MAEAKVLFEVDASKILAKLHLAGIQAAKEGWKNDDFLVNTGIVNDDPKAKPEKPGNVSFDLTNAQGDYEVGVVLGIEYQRSFNSQKNLDSLAQLYHQKAERKITDKQEDVDKKIEDLKTQYKKTTGYAKPLDSLDDIKAAQEEAKKSSGKDKEEYNKKVADARKLATNSLQRYFEVFVGAANLKNKVDENSLVMLQISNKISSSTDKNLVKNYEIVPISEKDKELMLKQFQQHPEKCEEKLCFKVAYSVELDK